MKKFLDMDHLNIYTQKVKELVDEKNNETLKKVYSVGSIYLSTIDINPYELFGFGIWERLEPTFLVGQIIYIFNMLSLNTTYGVLVYYEYMVYYEYYYGVVLFRMFLGRVGL